MNILYQFNDGYAPFACVSIASIIENNRNVNDISFYIMGEDLSEKSIRRISEEIEKNNSHVFFVETRSIINLLKENGILPYRGSYSAYFKMFAATAIDFSKNEDKRLLYVDCDTIIVDSLDEMYNMDMAGKAIGMVQESLIKERTYDKLYYNTGVILFDIDMFLTKKCPERVINELKKQNNYADADQGIINNALCDEIYEMDPRYNIQPGHMAYPIKLYLKIYGKNGYYPYDVIKNAVDNPVIYHTYRFLGQFPWNIDSLHPSRDLFDYYLGLSEWSDYTKEHARLNGIIYRIERIMYKILPKELFLHLFSVSHDLALKISGKRRQKGKDITWF